MTSSFLDAQPEDARRIAASVGPDAQPSSGKTVLLAGGAGFLGRHFIATPCQLLSVDSFITGNRVWLTEDGRRQPEYSRCLVRCVVPFAGSRRISLHHLCSRSSFARLLHEIFAGNHWKRRSGDQNPS